MITEIWKPVLGFEGLYEVSDLGRVRSIDRIVPDTNPASVSGIKCLKGVILYQHEFRGYLLVHLYKESKGYNKRVHRLVMEAFCGVKKGFDVNHIDSDRANNRLKNLEYATRAENMQHCVKQGRWAGPKPEQIPRAIRPDIDRIFALHAEGKNPTTIAREVGIKCPKTVITVLEGRHWTQRQH